MSLINWDEIQTSQTLIHDQAIIVDLGFTKRDKLYILSRVQYWKNYLRQHGYKTILISSNATIDTIALFFASAELGVVIETSNLADGPDAFLRRSQQAEINFISPHFTSNWFDYRVPNAGLLVDKNIFVLHEDEITKEFERDRPVYVSDRLDPEHDLITGEVVAGVTLTHTTGRFMCGGMMSAELFTTKDRFGSNNGITHVGLLTQVILGPLFAGATLYSINNFYDVVFLAARNTFTKVFFYDIHLKLIEWHPNFALPIATFKNTTVYTAGSLPSPHFIDVVFGAGADHIVSLFGTFSAACPVFKLEIPNNKFDVYSCGLGQVFNGVQYKIVDDKLWIKSPSQSKYVQNLDTDGFFNTGDFVNQRDDGTLHFLGREFVTLPDGAKVFVIEIQNTIQSVLTDDLFYSEYMVELPTLLDNTINIYPLSLRASRILEEAHNQIIMALGNQLEISSVLQVVIHKVVDDANLFTGRISMSRVKQLIAEGKTL